MTREEMLDGLEGGGDPFTLSIKKWEDIWLGVSGTPEEDNCALCHLFIRHQCKYCPIYRYTGKEVCGNTPFVKFVEHCQYCDICGPFHICNKGRGLARKEVDFLKKLDKW